jgi:hypothetical protein
MFGRDEQTFRTVVDLLDAWRPSKDYRSESKFQNELAGFLDEQLNEQGQDAIGGLIGGAGENYVVSRERGKSNGDVVVDDTVGIELKRNFSNSQKHRLRGQLDSYADHYPYVIALACGIEDPDGWRDLENKKTQQRMGIGMNQTEFRFIIKKRRNFGEPHDFGRDGGLGNIPGI